MTMKPHRRQFIITTDRKHDALNALPSFRTKQLSDGLFLHFDEELIVTEDQDRLILGRMLREGDGRYVVIKDGWLSLDASGSLGVHYSLDGDVICSSSPILLQKFTGCGIRMPQTESAFNWVAAPDSPAEGSLRLFSDQELNLEDRQTRVARRDSSGPYSLESAAAFLAAESKEIARALGQTNRPLFVALTAGQDSRTIFAALIDAKVPFKAFTMRLSNGASQMDLRVASAICEIYGIEHIVVSAQHAGGKKRLADYMRHSGGIDGDRGREYAAGNYYRVIPDDAIVLHGGSLGLSKPPFEYIFGDDKNISQEDAIEAVNNTFGPLSFSDKDALEKWFDYRAENPIGSIGDHFFLDQRRATWGADNRFSEDIFGFEWFIFANSWPLIDCFWSVPHEAREGLLVQKRAIEIMAPGLNDKAPQVNPGLSWLERMRGRFSKRGIQKIKRRFHRLVEHFR